MVPSMKKMMKKLVAGVSACLLLVSALSGCYSEDKAWAARRGDDTAPIGAYIYYLSNAYQEALTLVEDDTKSVFDQEIDGKDGAQWVKDRARESLKLMYYVDQRMEDLGLTLDEDDQSQIESLTGSQWSAYSASFDQYGIAQTSLERAYSQFIVEYQKVFEAVYGPGGEKEVSDDELREYYEGAYVDVDYFTCAYTKYNESGSTDTMTDDEKAEAAKEYQQYVTRIQNGELTMEEAAEEYQAARDEEAAAASSSSSESSSSSSSSSSDDSNSNLASETVNLESSHYPEEMTAKIQEMDENTVDFVDIPDSNMFVIIQKNPISEACDEMLSDAEQRLSVLSELKNDEYTADMEEGANALDDITFNDSVLDSYDPHMFFSESDLSSASSESSGSSTSSTSSESSSSESSASSESSESSASSESSESSASE